MATNIIEFKKITKTFHNGKLIANNKISLAIKQGEIHAIAGENGAGKSTLLSMLFGLFKPDEGQILVRGKVVNYQSAADAMADRLGMVQQHFQLIDKYNVGQNILLGKEKTVGPFLDFKSEFGKINALAKAYDFGIRAEQKIATLNVGQQQKTEILKLLYSDVEVLIFDEPTAMLIPQEIEHLLKVLLALKKKGKTIILITHKLAEIKAVADRVSVIRQGELVGQISSQDIDAKKLGKLMVGKNIAIAKKEQIKKGKPILRIENLVVKKQGVEQVKKLSLTVHAGEILALAGVEGNGQTELVNSVLGLAKITQGKIEIFCQKGQEAKKWHLINHWSISQRNDFLASIPEDRHKYGMVLDLKVYENMTLKTFWKNYSTYGFLNRLKMQNQSLTIINQYDVRGTNKGQAISRNLSGGNQQKAVVGREISLNRDLLIVFQATRGLDIGAIEYIHQQILQAAKNQKAILLVSYDLQEIMKLADRVLVINRGKITGELVKQAINLEQLGMLMAVEKKGGTNEKTTATN